MIMVFDFEPLSIHDVSSLFPDGDQSLLKKAYAQWHGDFACGLNNLYGVESPIQIKAYAGPDLGSLLDYIHGDLMIIAPMIPLIWDEWFRYSTRVSQPEQIVLREMRYKEYLQSRYWQRVRAAMLLIANLRCQSVGCVGLDSWMHHEYDLHVHHLHYKNRGCETLANLRVLCADCHKSVHEFAR